MSSQECPEEKIVFLNNSEVRLERKKKITGKRVSTFSVSHISLDNNYEVWKMGFKQPQIEIIIFDH